MIKLYYKNRKRSIMEKYVPDIYQKSVYDINYSKLSERGIKCLLFDLDNTLVFPNIKEPTKDLIDLFNNLKQDFKVIIFSNSPNRRLKPFGDILEVEYSYSSRKPFKKKFLEVIKRLGYDLGEIAIIGDQILTDIVGGNSVGITTILTEPLTKKDMIFTKFNRQLEKVVIKKLMKKNLFNKGRYYYD